MKKRKKIINVIKVVIVSLMAIAIAFSALAPVFGEENAEKKEEVLEKTVPQEAQEKSVEARKRVEKEVREGITVAIEKLEEIEKDVLLIPKETVRTVRAQGIPQGFSFGYELRERATGEVVRYLQKVLNIDPSTRIAVSGPGSPGNETSYFGPGTKKALIKFQQKHGISATGFFGPQTRTKMNEVLQSGVTLREPVEGKMEEIRERFMEVVQMVRQLREKLNQSE